MSIGTGRVLYFLLMLDTVGNMVISPLGLADVISHDNVETLIRTVSDSEFQARALSGGVPKCFEHSEAKIAEMCRSFMHPSTGYRYFPVSPQAVARTQP